MASSKSLGYYQSGCATAKTIAELIAVDVPAACDYVDVQVEVQACRWRDDGTAPTAAIGTLLAAGATLRVRRAQFANFKLIQVTGTALANLSLYQTG